MASEPKSDERDDVVFSSRIPRPVEGGTEHLESLGRFVDNLMGDSRLRARVQAELEPLLMPEDEMPEDPPPSEPPPPVPDGTEEIIRGADSTTERR
jgi:hypothetical protein